MKSVNPLIYVFLVTNIGLALVFIGAWLSNIRRTRPYMRAGIAVALVLFSADMAMLLFADTGKSPGTLMLLEFWVLVRIYAFVVVGSLLADRLNALDTAPTSSLSGTLAQTNYGLTAPSPRALIHALLAVAFFVAFTLFVFEVTGARIHEALLVGEDDPFRISFLGIVAVATMGFAEEITFRLGLQNGLTYWWRSSPFAHHWAVLATSLFWSLGHLGTVDPGWAKVVQVVAIGIVLGHMNRRFGVIPCIVAHSTFNVVMALLAPTVFGHMVEPI